MIHRIVEFALRQRFMVLMVTLFVVPVVYALLRKKLPTKHLLDTRFAREERGEEISPEAAHATAN